MIRLGIAFLLIFFQEVHAAEVPIPDLNTAKDIGRRIMNTNEGGRTRLEASLNHIVGRHSYRANLGSSTSHFCSNNRDWIRDIIRTTVENADEYYFYPSFDRLGNPSRMLELYKSFNPGGFNGTDPIGEDDTGKLHMHTVKVGFNITGINALGDASVIGFLATSFPIEP
jgi:hypothetical protein